MPAPPVPIIIKKIKKSGGHGHHGGAWKVAYADFVTAMMAFFLLMWLLNATSEDQKRGISNYFGPYGNAQGAGGVGGVMGGKSLQSEGQWNNNKTAISISTPSIRVEKPEEGETKQQNDPSEEEGTPGGPQEEGKGDSPETSEAQENATPPQAKAEDKKLEIPKPVLENVEDRLFKEAQENLSQSIESVPELKELAKNLIVDKTPEGLRIQIVDQNGLSMFPVGSSQMQENMKRLLNLVAKVTLMLPNKISISGHTDSKPYAKSTSYGNWELSSDRANASRRILLEAGLTPERIYSVVGKADTEPLVASDPNADNNRRISIVLRKKSLDQGKDGIEDRQKMLSLFNQESP